MVARLAVADATLSELAEPYAVTVPAVSNTSGCSGRRTHQQHA
jgi:hypothetical protein